MRLWNMTVSMLGFSKVPLQGTMLQLTFHIQLATQQTSYR